MRRKERQITERSEIDTVIRGSTVCHLGLAAGDEPYVLPISFGYDGGAVYFHTARAGRKIEFISANPRVCLQFERAVRLVPGQDAACKWTFAFESAIATGVVRELLDRESKTRGLNVIMLQYSGREWSFDAPALDATRVWRVVIENVTGKRSEAKAT